MDKVMTTYVEKTTAESGIVVSPSPLPPPLLPSTPRESSSVRSPVPPSALSPSTPALSPSALSEAPGDTEPATSLVTTTTAKPSDGQRLIVPASSAVAETGTSNNKPPPPLSSPSVANGEKQDQPNITVKLEVMDPMSCVVMDWLRKVQRKKERPSTDEQKLLAKADREKQAREREFARMARRVAARISALNPTLSPDEVALQLQTRMDEIHRLTAISRQNRVKESRRPLIKHEKINTQPLHAVVAVAPGTAAIAATSATTSSARAVSSDQPLAGTRVTTQSLRVAVPLLVSDVLPFPAHATPIPRPSPPVSPFDSGPLPPDVVYGNRFKDELLPIGTNKTVRLPPLRAPYSLISLCGRYIILVMWHHLTESTAADLTEADAAAAKVSAKIHKIVRTSLAAKPKPPMSAAPLTPLPSAPTSSCPMPAAAAAAATAAATAAAPAVRPKKRKEADSTTTTTATTSMPERSVRNDPGSASSPSQSTAATPVPAAVTAVKAKSWSRGHSRPPSLCARVLVCPPEERLHLIGPEGIVRPEESFIYPSLPVMCQRIRCQMNALTIWYHLVVQDGITYRVSIDEWRRPRGGPGHLPSFFEYSPDQLRRMHQLADAVYKDTVRQKSNEYERKLTQMGKHYNQFRLPECLRYFLQVVPSRSKATASISISISTTTGSPVEVRTPAGFVFPVPTRSFSPRFLSFARLATDFKAAPVSDTRDRETTKSSSKSPRPKAKRAKVATTKAAASTTVLKHENMERTATTSSATRSLPSEASTRN